MRAGTGDLVNFEVCGGIGGISLGLKMAGIETVGFCEIDPFCCKVLARRWPDSVVMGDIHDVTKASMIARGLNVGAISILSGGIPCQPYSIAGKQQGSKDNRYLWPEMRRLIGEIRPNWVIFENVENLVRMGLDDICSDLEGIDYSIQPLVVSSYCSGALFDGKRVFVVAASNDRSRALRRDGKLQPVGEIAGRRGYNRGRAAKFIAGQRWKVESRPYGVADGVPDRMDRIRALGNAVVPQVVEVIGRAITAVEEGF